MSGNTALIAANTGGSAVPMSSGGAAYVFTFNGTKWIQQQELTACSSMNACEFGISVAVSGTTALVRSEIGSASIGTPHLLWSDHVQRGFPITALTRCFSMADATTVFATLTPKSRGSWRSNFLSASGDFR